MEAKILEGCALRYPVEHKNLGQFLFSSAEKYADRICQIDGSTDEKETYASVKERSTRVAIALHKRGITFEDAIVFCSTNTLDVAIPILASFYLGAKVASLEPSLSARHTKHLLSLVTPKIIFVEESASTLIEESLKGTNFETEIIIFGKSIKYTTFSELVTPQENEDKFRPADVDGDNVALMFFSSGTTGMPKAICHSHNSFLYAINQIYQIGLRKALLHFTTLYWITAMAMLGCTFKAGSYRIFCRDANPENIFRVIEKYKVEGVFFAPILTYKLTSFENAKNYDTSSLKTIICGGTPMSVLQLQKLNDLFKSATTSLGYGMSEIGSVTVFSLDDDYKFIMSKLASSGKPAPTLRLKVVNLDTNEVLGPKQKGEIRIISPAIMKGYYNADSAHVFDEEGFLKTGDVGYYDEDGCVYVIERIKEMFKYQSWHIIPSSIEAVLLEHPSIKEAVVFGVPRDEEGEVPAACVVLNESNKITKEEIHAFLAERLADREKLRGGITFVKLLPKTPSGKVIRKDVRNLILKSSENYM